MSVKRSFTSIRKSFFKESRKVLRSFIGIFIFEELSHNQLYK